MYFPVWETDSLYPKLHIVTFQINTFRCIVTSSVQTLQEKSNQQNFLAILLTTAVKMTCSVIFKLTTSFLKVPADICKKPQRQLKGFLLSS